MKRTAFLLLFVLLNGLLFAQDAAEKKKKGKKEKKEKVEKVDLSEKEQERPVNPWVFEAGLEEKPGRLVIALNKNLWLAYDTTTCSIMRIWRGSAFVNSNSENKDMIVEGFQFVETPGTQKVWTLKKGNKQVDAEIAFDGYEVLEEKVSMLYTFTLTDGRSFQVKESPEYQLQKKPNSNRITLVRSFEVINPLAGISVLLDFEMSNMPKMGDIKTSSKFVDIKKSKRMYDWGDMFSAEGSLLLNTAKVSTFHMTLTMDGEAYYRARPSSN